jgi:transposase
MMGRQDRDQGQLFYEFSLDEIIPTDHLLRRINGFATAVLADLHEQLKRFYSEIGRPSVDPELMVRMLLDDRFHETGIDGTGSMLVDSSFETERGVV